ncbi:MAG: protein kinase [Desulfobacterales bacterium]
MAEVYRGKLIGEQGFEKLVVIKRMLPQIAAKDEMVAAFIDEARLAALLQHENIIHVYDFGEMNGGYFMAMEYLFGQELRAVMDKSLEANRRMPLADCLYVVARICDGLHYAHELKDLHQRSLNIIHRDISPQNIFVTYDGKIRIIDFGIAKTSLQSVRTQTGLVKGKLAYMSPEQAKGSILDRRSDIFSTGAVLYEMITGCRMYQGTDTAEVLQKVIEADFPPPESIREDIPAPVCGILKRALAKQESDRYENIGQMLTDIEECMFELSLRGNAQTLSKEMKALFEGEYAAETEDIQRVIDAEAAADETMTTSTNEGDVFLPAGSGPPTPAVHVDDEVTRTETISLPSDQNLSTGLSAARSPSVSKPHKKGAPGAGAKGIQSAPRSGKRVTLTNAIVTVLIIASVIWIVSSQERRNPPAPASKTPTAAVAVKEDRPEKPQKAPPERKKTQPQGQGQISSAPLPEMPSGTGSAGADSREKLHGNASETAVPRADRPAATPDEENEKASVAPAPIPHKASRSKKTAGAKGNHRTSEASARAAAIKSMLAKAESHLKKYRLTSPEKDCAYYYFKKILLLDPGNAAARQGILRIGDAYGRLADGEISRFQYEKAQDYVNKGLRVDPRNPHLLALNKKLSQGKPFIFIEDVGNKVKDLFD